jgi:hypothetical protein
MGFKEWPAWLKCSLIGIFISILYSILFALTTCCEKGYGCDYSTEFWGILLISILFYSIIFFTIGSAIGFLVELKEKHWSGFSYSRKVVFLASLSSMLVFFALSIFYLFYIFKGGGSCPSILWSTTCRWVHIPFYAGLFWVMFGIPSYLGILFIGLIIRILFEKIFIGKVDYFKRLQFEKKDMFIILFGSIIGPLALFIINGLEFYPEFGGHAITSFIILFIVLVWIRILVKTESVSIKGA